MLPTKSSHIRNQGGSGIPLLNTVTYNQQYCRNRSPENNTNAIPVNQDEIFTFQPNLQRFHRYKASVDHGNAMIKLEIEYNKQQ